jgi:DNA-binding Lrp family transcriptional regulator
MDHLDTRLIALLRENARLPVATLARQLKVSRGTVQNRIDRLLEDRVLLGFTVRTTPEAASHRIRAVTMVRTEGDADQVLRTLRGLPEVRALHTTNGRWDIVAELAAGVRRGAAADREGEGRGKHRDQLVALDAQAVGRLSDGSL